MDKGGQKKSMPTKRPNGTNDSSWCGLVIKINKNQSIHIKGVFICRIDESESEMRMVDSVYLLK